MGTLPQPPSGAPITQTVGPNGQPVVTPGKRRPPPIGLGASAGIAAPGGGPPLGVPGTGTAGTSLNPFGASPNSYNVNSNLQSSEGLAQYAYGQANAAEQGIATNPPPTANIQAQTIAVPAAITAQAAQASDLVQGQQADALRTQQLGQAATAAASPSSAAAQMKAAGTQIQNQQLGQAAMARGADRAGAARAAMLGTGAQGMQAASTTAALAAQEQAAKQQAYTQALGGVRAGDVSGAQTQQAITLANQGTNLQAQTTTGAQALAAAQANQGANLTAQQATIQNQQAGYFGGLQAENAFMGTELQGVGAQNQGQAVASGYGQSQNSLNQTKGGAVWSGLSGMISDVRAKTEISPLPNIYGGHPVENHAPNFLSANYQAPPLSESAGAYPLNFNFTSPEGKNSPYSKVMGLLKGGPNGGGAPAGGESNADTVDAGGEDVEGDPTAGTEDVAGEAGAEAGGEEAGGELLDIASDEYCKNDVTPIGGGQSYSGLLQNAYGLDSGGSGSPYSSEGSGHQDFLDWNWSPLDRGAGASPSSSTTQQSSSSSVPGMGSLPGMSDERAKAQAEHMDQDEIAAWSEAVPTAVFRYKPGTPETDGGADYHAGTLAQSLERTGPMGKLMVHQRPDGLKEVEYGPLGLMVGKGALTKADQALQLAQAAYAMAAEKKGTRHGRV